MSRILGICRELFSDIGITAMLLGIIRVRPMCTGIHWSYKTVNYTWFRLQPLHGHINVSMDPVRLKGVKSWPIPKMVKEVWAFLGFTGFYHHFVRAYSNLARPLHDLLKKNQPWKWELVQQLAFNEIRDMILTAPILIFPDFNKKKMIETNSSNFTTGGVLNQLT
jgi:hypothetical protein